MATTKNTKRTTAPGEVPRKMVTAIRATLENLATGEANVQRLMLAVGQAVHDAMRDGYTAASIAAALEAEGYKRTKGWYSQVRAAHAALADAKVSHDDAIGPRGDEEHIGGIGGVSRFGIAANAVYTAGGDIPAFVDAWRHGINPPKPESATVGMQVYRADAKFIRSMTGDGVKDADIIRAAVQAYRDSMTERPRARKAA